MAPIIRVEHLRKVYRVGKEKVIALNDVNLAIEPGEICCIVGPSGSGKSTLLNQLAGLEKPTKGSVYIGKHEISAMNENQLAKFRQAHLGFIFQSYNLLPNLTAAENVALPLMFKGVPRKKRLEMAKAELKRMGVVLKRAQYFITCKGKAAARGSRAEIAGALLDPKAFSVGMQQLSLDDFVPKALPDAAPAVQRLEARGMAADMAARTVRQEALQCLTKRM